MEKEAYENLEMEIITFDEEDIITASGPFSEGGEVG